VVKPKRSSTGAAGLIITDRRITIGVGCNRPVLIAFFAEKKRTRGVESGLIQPVLRVTTLRPKITVRAQMKN